MSNPLWFKDAVIYQLHVKAFQDSDGDGIGDFGGLIQRLDYLAELGVTALWIMPFYPSPLRDDGYDIADYLSVNPSYGTLEQFDAFMVAAHARGLRVITELVLNHTSDQHRGSSGRGVRGSARRSGTSTCGATRPIAIARRGSFSRTSSNRTGRGTAWRRRGSGTAFIRTSRI